MMKFSDFYRSYEGKSEFADDPTPIRSKDVKSLLFKKLPLSSVVPEGPWTSDLISHPYIVYGFKRNGLRYCVVKTSSLTWNGYVEIGNKDFDRDSIHVHGGITGGSKGWIGFDCYHGGDLSPMFTLESLLHDKDWSYKTFDYAVEQTKNLADQLL